MSELPKGWQQTKLAEVATLKTGPFGSALHKSDYTNGGIPLINPTHIRGGRLAPANDVAVSVETSGRLSEYQLNEGDIVMGRRGEMGRCAVVPPYAQGWLCGTGSVVIKSTDAIAPQYLQRFLTAHETVARLVGDSVGSTMVNLNQGVLLGLEVPLAPLPEQKRIADKLDALLGRVDACRDRLDRLPALLKRFRQSILAAATSGRLTEDWRATRSPGEAQRYPGTATELLTQIASEQAAAKMNSRGGKVTPSLTDLPDAIDLPKGWEVAGFDALAAPVKYALKAGPFGSALKKHMYVPAGYKIYGQEQVIAGDENLGDYFIDEEKYQELSNCAIRPGDILISLVGTIGRVLILSEQAKPGIINPRLVKLSLHATISREYISLYLASPTAQNFFGNQSHGGTMDILNLGILRELPILLPSPSEQVEVVRRVETLFAFADRLEARLATARKQAEQLTPALLAKAFRGELVPQDPNDEPATELLKRLATTRSEAPKVKRGRARKDA